MKKPILTLAAVAAFTVPALAQGGAVIFSNFTSNKPVQWDENNDGVGDRELTPADGVEVSLWFAPYGTTDPNDPVWQMLGQPTPLLLPGLFTTSGVRRVPSAQDGVPYAFLVRGWETTIYGTAPTGWELASGTLGSKVTTYSPILATVTGGFGAGVPGPAVSLSPLFADQPNIVVGTVVPEPSVLTLAALGAGALLLLRRWWR